MKKKTTRSEKAAASKNRIFQCGVALIKKHGFEQVTVEQIANEAGVSVGTYYYYYPSKFELLSEIFHQGDVFFQDFPADISAGENASQQILRFFEKYAELTTSNGVEMIKNLYTSNNKLFILKGRSMQNILFEIIDNGQEDKEIPAVFTPEELVSMLFIAARGVIYEWCLYDGNMDLKIKMNTIIGLLLKGICIEKKF